MEREIDVAQDGQLPLAAAIRLPEIPDLEDGWFDSPAVTSDAAAGFDLLRYK